MKIIQFTAENVKRLKCVDITPKTNVVQVTGKNGNGKSSILDSIFWALGGEKNIQDVPIRRGADSARIRLDLGDMVVERKFGKGEGLTVRNKTGAKAGTDDRLLPKYGSPQEILDALLGRLSFDPLAFSKKKPREQYDDLKSIAKIAVDIEGLGHAHRSRPGRQTSLGARGWQYPGWSC
jgi:AAA domain-containing protein